MNTSRTEVTAGVRTPITGRFTGGGKSNEGISRSQVDKRKQGRAEPERKQCAASGELDIRTIVHKHVRSNRNRSAERSHNDCKQNEPVVYPAGRDELRRRHEALHISMIVQVGQALPPEARTS